MKRVLITLTTVGALALSAGSVFARDVYSTAPDNDELGSVMTTQSDLAVPSYNSQALSAHNPINNPNIIQNDPATQPD